MTDSCLPKDNNYKGHYAARLSAFAIATNYMS